MRHPRPRAGTLLLAPLTLLLAACGAPGTPVVPGAQPTPISFVTANPGNHQGAVYGVSFVPFAEAGSPQGVMNAFQSGTVSPAGAVQGVLRPFDQIPRVNELLGLFVFGLFTVPEGCTATTSNGVEAALAPVLDLGVWDGTSIDEDGFPDFTAFVTLQETSDVLDPPLETRIDEFYVIVASRTAWTARVSACQTLTMDGDPFVFELDLAIQPGWLVLNVRDVYRFDTSSGDEAFETHVHALTIEEFEALGAVGQVVAADAQRAHLGRPTALGAVAPWLLR